jgi:hypothetical protein
MDLLNWESDRTLYSSLMNPAQLDQNADCINRELTWFNSVLDHRIKLHFEGETPPADLLALIPPPELPHTDAPYAEIVRQFNLQPAERLVLVLNPSRRISVCSIGLFGLSANAFRGPMGVLNSEFGIRNLEFGNGERSQLW